MESNDRKKMIQQGFDTVAAGYDHPSLSFFPETAKRLATEELIKEQFNAVNITNVSIHHEPQGYQMTDAQMWWDVVWNAGWRGC